MPGSAAGYIVLYLFLNSVPRTLFKSYAFSKVNRRTEKSIKRYSPNTATLRHNNVLHAYSAKTRFSPYFAAIFGCVPVVGQLPN